jgi:hypothetical protein
MVMSYYKDPTARVHISQNEMHTYDVELLTQSLKLMQQAQILGMESPMCHETTPHDEGDRSENNSEHGGNWSFQANYIQPTNLTNQTLMTDKKEVENRLEEIHDF